VFLVRGDLNAQIGNYEDALADYDQLIEVIPDNPALWLVRGHYNNSANHDSDGARDFFQWLTLIEQRRLEADPLALGDTVAVEMNEGWTYRIPFEARAGQEIVITAASLQVDPLVVLLDTGGVPIASDDDSGGGLDAAISGFNVPDHGTYTIVLGHARGGSSGSVTVKVASVGD
jgi:tetratricopeptide (TPR) repeat protein